jgi:hypothetical protein
MISSTLQRIAAIPRWGDTKTIACLTRTTALPYVFAVSGYEKGPFGSSDNALDRPTWTTVVYRLADLLRHDFKSDFREKRGLPGSFWACHAEKQVLALMISEHTTALMKDDVDLRRCSAPELSSLSTEILRLTHPVTTRYTLSIECNNPVFWPKWVQPACIMRHCRSDTCYGRSATPTRPFFEHRRLGVETKGQIVV